MFERLISGFQSDARKSVGAAVARMEGQTTMVALDTLYSAVRDGLAASGGAGSAKRLIDLITPIVIDLSDRALGELAIGDDNPVRRDLCSKRLNLLAEQLANACYMEALRARAELQRGRGDAAALAEWSRGYFRWLGLAHTARALQDANTQLGWDGVCGLYLALVQHGGLPAGPAAADNDTARALAYLLLINDAFPAVAVGDVAAAARACQFCAATVQLASDFHRTTPLVMSAVAGQGQRLVGWGGPSTEEPALCYGLDDAATMLRKVADDVQAGQSPIWMQQSAEAELVLRRLAAAWGDAPGRGRNPALAKHPKTRAAFEFMRIRGLLGQKSGRLPSDDRLIVDITMIDADEQGVSFMIPADARPLLDSGLIAMVISRSAWWLAWRQRVERDGQKYFVTARWLGHDAEPARVVGETGDAWRSLYVHPGVANQYRGGFVLDSANIALGKTYRAEVGNETISLLPEEVLPLGQATWWYPCRAQQS
ncbi:MAG: hypothetical protein JO218_05585 [Burkholderiales bacterium]|nr:hypothetical protein [Burkholderiales bacterium]